MSEGPGADTAEAVFADGRASLDAEQLATSSRGRLLRHGTRSIHGGAVDSRRVTAGGIFFALAGDRTDGHRFLSAAVAAGAAALVVSDELTETELDALHGSASEVTIVAVADAAVALRSIAAAYRDRFDPLVVGVTGSIAKTSTKEQIAAILGPSLNVLRSEGNENNEIGLPLTLLRLEEVHEVAVLEMGLYTTGEIALLARLAKPSIGVVTAVRGVHLERAGSIEAIEAGKRELVEALPPAGWAILNADDPRVVAMAGSTPAQVRTYGFSAEADIRATDVVSKGRSGMAFRLHLQDAAHEVSTPALGRHGVHNALAAAAVALCTGMSERDIVAGLRLPFSVPHRSQLIDAGPWTILDDSYNASPDAVLAALSLLAELPGRRIAVLGEMLELGDATEPEHLRVGRHAAATADHLVVVGDGAAGIAAGAAQAGLDADAIKRVADRDVALTYLVGALRPGDSVLVKASRNEGLDVLVERLVLAAAAGEATA